MVKLVNSLEMAKDYKLTRLRSPWCSWWCISSVRKSAFYLFNVQLPTILSYGYLDTVPNCNLGEERPSECLDTEMNWMHADKVWVS